MRNDAKQAYQLAKDAMLLDPENKTAEDLKIMREHFSRGVKMSGPMDPANIRELLRAASGRTDGYIDFDPMRIRIGEGTLIEYIKPDPAGIQPGQGTLINRI